MGDAAAKEPTMEDILSSIRKIIAEEGDLPDDVAARQNDSAPDNEAQPEVIEREAESPETTGVSSVSETVEIEEAPVEAEIHDTVEAVEVEEAPMAVEIEETPVEEPVAVAGSLAQIAAGLQSEEAEINPPFRPLEAQETNPAEVEESNPEMASRSLADIAAAVKAMENTGEAEPVEAEPGHGVADAPGEQRQAPPVEQVAPVQTQQAPQPQAAAPQPQEVQPQPQEVQVPSQPQQPQAVAPPPAPAPTPASRQLTEQEATYAEMSRAMEGPAAGTAAAEINRAQASSSEEAAFKGALMSPGVDQAVASSFERLKRSMMDDLDAKTESIMRPLLREWLDENLPNMVERLVREEIERVARG